jgi:hypothetical protein
MVITFLSVSAMAERTKNESSIEISGFDCADKSVHMIEWLGLGKDYRSFVVSDVEKELSKQQPGSQLLKLECTGEPELLTGALPQEDGASKAILTRFSATFPLLATVNLSGSIWVLNIDQNYYIENLNIPEERKLTQNFTVKGSAEQ